MVPRKPSHRDCLVQDVSLIHQGVERVASYVVENGMAHVQIGGKTYFLPVQGVNIDDAVAQLLIGLTKAQLSESSETSESLELEPQAKKSG